MAETFTGFVKVLTTKKTDMKATTFIHWDNGRVGNFGSFKTSILQAYRLADSGNRKRLETAFPEWFVEEYELPNPIRFVTG